MWTNLVLYLTNEWAMQPTHGSTSVQYEAVRGTQIIIIGLADVVCVIVTAT